MYILLLDKLMIYALLFFRGSENALLVEMTDSGLVLEMRGLLHIE